jgi:hypothetical protein
MMVEYLEKEIEFYKEITGRLTTVTVLTVAGTITAFQKYGFGFWSIVGLASSIAFSIALILNMWKWKVKISALKGVENDNT